MYQNNKPEQSFLENISTSQLFLSSLNLNLFLFQFFLSIFFFLSVYVFVPLVFDFPSIYQLSVKKFRV